MRMYDVLNCFLGERWEEKNAFQSYHALGSHDDMSVITHARKRSLREENDLLGIQAKILILLVEWIMKEIPLDHKLKQP